MHPRTVQVTQGGYNQRLIDRYASGFGCRLSIAQSKQRNAWLLAIRPKTLPAAVAPVLVGSSVAIQADKAIYSVMATCFIVAVLLQIAANLANDYFDFQRGADTSHRLGPTRVTQSGFIPASQVKAGTMLVLGLVAICGLYLVWRGGLPILILGLLAIVSALIYTGGPFPIGYHGLGEVFVFIFFGIVAVTGTFYVQALEVTDLSLAAAIPMGCTVTAILVVNNLRDLDTDRAAGKRTISVMIGKSATIWEYIALVVIPFIALPVMWLTGLLSVWWFIPFLSLPIALYLMQGVRSVTGAALNGYLARTAQWHLLYGVLLSLSILLS